MPRANRDKPSARKRVKARGALPSPVTAPKRTHKQWYQRRNVQLAIAAGSIFVGVVVFLLVQELLESREERRLEIRAIERFQRELQLLNAPLSAVYQQITTSPDQMLSAEVSVDEYRAQAQSWVDEFRKLYEGIKQIEVLEGPEGLAIARTSFAQGAVILLDAGKAFLAAASVEGEPRAQAVGLGRNLLYHGGTVLAMGERQFQRIKNEYDLNVPAVDLPPPVIPEEEAPPPAPAIDPNLQPPAASPSAGPATSAATSPPASPSVGPAASPAASPGS